MKNLLFFKHIIVGAGLIIALGGQLFAQDAVTASNAALAELHRLEQALADSESAYGPFDPRLLEPLLRLEQELMRQGDFDSVLDLQNRRLQISRTAYGLQDPAVLPVLEDIIATRIMLGQFEAVTDSLEHVHSIQVANFGADSEAALASLARQADWYLVRVAVDSERSAADNFLDARDLYEDLFILAEQRFGEGSPELIPWHYRRAFNLYQLVDLLNTDSGVAGATVNELVYRDGTARLHSFSRPGLAPLSFFGPASRVPVVEEGEDVGVGYLREALGFIDDIIEIAESRQDQELLALATLYHGDFQLLMDRGIGRRDYRKAREMLIEAGIERDRVDRFLATPMVIPHAQFFHRFDAMEAYQQELLSSGDPGSDAGTYVGVFTAWQEDIAATPRPEALSILPEELLATHQAEVSFRLSSKGRVTSVDVLSSDPDERGVRADASRAVRDIHFRPAMIDGRNKSMRDLRLLYRYPPED